MLDLSWFSLNNHLLIPALSIFTLALRRQHLAQEIEAEVVRFRVVNLNFTELLVTNDHEHLNSAHVTELHGLFHKSNATLTFCFEAPFFVLN